MQQSFGLGMLCAHRTAEDFSKHDLRQLMDGIRLGTIATFEAFKHAWDAIMISVQSAVLHPAVQPDVQRDLIRFMAALKEKWGRMRVLGSILPGKLTWAAKRTFIQNVCGWSEDGALDHGQFRQDHKDLQMLSQLYRYSEADSFTENPYGQSGVFGSEKDAPVNRQACSACGKRGHKAVDCRGKGKGGPAGKGAPPVKVPMADKKCFQCGKLGHIKANCPN
jgi:hypothetical protein